MPDLRLAEFRIDDATIRRGRKRKNVLRAMLAMAFVWLGAMQAWANPSSPAYKFAAPVNVGGTAESGTATVVISAAGTLSAVNVVTQGVAGEDFALAAGGSCATGATYSSGQTCTVAVSF
ncbi:MAG TPA: hypothetical protein VGU23_00345, partial [Acidobacteriaceae bacterium]|nr:hypothetical protein [Acidobacteriaceae bacterium]